jgi:hypothetical protein
MGLKRGAIGNTLEEHVRNLGNILGTHWELERNIWEQRKKEKIISPPPPPTAPGPKTKIKAL